MCVCKRGRPLTPSQTDVTRLGDTQETGGSPRNEGESVSTLQRFPSSTTTGLEGRVRWSKTSRPETSLQLRVSLRTDSILPRPVNFPRDSGHPRPEGRFSSCPTVLRELEKVGGSGGRGRNHKKPFTLLMEEIRKLSRHVCKFICNNCSSYPVTLLTDRLTVQ